MEEKFDKNSHLTRWEPGNEYMRRNYALGRTIKDSGIKDPDGSYTNTFFMHGFGQLSFLTDGCRLGQCCFCTYGALNHDLSPQIVEREMDAFINNVKNNPHTIYSVLFDAVGSILDSKEFPPECLDVVLKKAEELLKEVPTIEELSFETHYQTLGYYDKDGKYVTSEALNKIIAFKEAHPEVKDYVIELGLESANNELRDQLLLKHINDKTFARAIYALHEHGIKVDANIMATVPFLTKKEQIEESVNSIITALTPYEEGGYGVDKVVLFPLNVRENTFCDYVFKSADAYAEKHPEWQKPSWLDNTFSIWSMVATLKVLADQRPDLLDKVSVAAWFGGDRILSDSDVQPDDWQTAYDLLVAYRAAMSPEEKIAIINQLASTPAYQEYMQSKVMNEPEEKLSYTERAMFINKLTKEVNLPVKSKCSKANQSN